MRAISAISIAFLLTAVAARHAAAAPITYDFSGTLSHGPGSDPGNTAVIGQFTIDADTSTITGFDFQTPVGQIAAGGWTPYLWAYTPAYSPAANVVRLLFSNGSGTLLSLIFQTTLASFDGSTFYTGLLMPTSTTATGAGLRCEDYTSTGPCYGLYTTAFASGAATLHGPPTQPATVPEPTSLALLAGGLATLIARRRPRPPRSR
jgi:hypothetical protein